MTRSIHNYKESLIACNQGLLLIVFILFLPHLMILL
ncbi:hypothetical protein EDC33_1303 [Salinicoccus roseus]|nr:hypothetical protein EDC33_1303 [Salinicoccus roseus]